MPDSPGQRDSRMSRRTFSRRVATAAAGLLLGPAMLAQEAPMSAATPPSSPPSPNSEVALAAILEACPGLPESDRKELADQVKSVLDLQKALRKLKVADGTEPDFVFRAAVEARYGR